jgi:molecular chaperone DnaJ
LERKINFSKNISCTHCQGSGAEPGAKIETCKSCGGSGRVTKIQRTILGNIQTQSTCEQCGGEGKIYSQRCSRCGGSGIHRESVDIKVKIPAGINDGESIRLAGQGEAGEKGAPAGDLYLRINVSNHKKFIRDGYNIHTEEKINIRQAILGDKIDIETIHGSVKLKIPEGTQSGTIFKIREKGISKLRGGGIGDQYVKVIVEIPKGLGRKDKKMLEEMDL